MGTVSKNSLALRDYVTANSGRMISDLLAMTARPSVRSDAAPAAPYGRDCAACLEFCASMFAREGFRTEIFADSGYALVKYRDPVPGEEYVGVFCHSDVVPADAKDWAVCPPFEPCERDGVLYGRGIMDNKSSIAIMLNVFRGLRDLGINPKKNIIVFIGSNEESGMGDVRAFAKEQPLPAVSIVPDSSFPVCLGEKGIFRVDVTAQKPRDVLSVKGGCAYNTVMASLECVIRDREGLREYIAEKGAGFAEVTGQSGDTLTLTVTGVACHAGRPYRGDSALRRLSVLLSECRFISSEDRALFTRLAADLGDPYGEGIGIDSADPVLGRLSVANGIVYTDVDGRIAFTLDIRYGKEPGLAAVEKKVFEIYENRGWSVKKKSGSEALVIPGNDETACKLLSVYRELTGDAEAKPYYMTGGTYAKYLPHACAVGVSLGDARIEAKLPDGHGRAHEPDEALSVRGYTAGAGILAAFVAETAELP